MFSYRLALRLGMIREEMMARMPAHEFFEWMAIERMDNPAPTETVQRPAQTPQQIFEMFPVTKPKPPKRRRG